MDRRRFLRYLAGAAGSASVLPSVAGAAKISEGDSDRLGALLPQRSFADTGEKLTIMGVGGAHIGRSSESECQRIIEEALESGVRFFDNAWKYHDGLSEERYGRYLTPRYRDDVFIMSKADSRDGGDVGRQLEDSLRRMKTDYLDLWLIHTVSSPEDADHRVPEMLPVMHRARDEGKVRHFGFSGHTVTSAHLHVLELAKGDILKSCLMPISPVDAASEDSFTIVVLPRLLEEGYAPLAMKSMNSGRIFREYDGDTVVPGRLTLEENIWFTLSLPICSWVSGMPSVKNLRENVKIAQSFTSLTEGDRQAIVHKVVQVADADGLQPYKEWLF